MFGLKHKRRQRIRNRPFQLDSEPGANEGAPLLPRRSMYIAWARVLGDEYQHLINDLQHHHKTDLDAYGATNPAEFFAVVTEAFFEKPIQLKHRHPSLYEQLNLFYRQDPARRLAGLKESIAGGKKTRLTLNKKKGVER